MGNKEMLTTGQFVALVIVGAVIGGGMLATIIKGLLLIWTI